ncbi:lectin C-type domain protein, partial [Teladorsagia circumcincta]
MRAVTVFISILIGVYGTQWHAPTPDTTTVRYGNYHYKIYPLEASFHEAEDLCVAQGGHLASIHNKEENNIVYWLMRDNEPTMGDYDEAWIGLRRKLLLWNHLEEDQLPMYSAWTWTDGTPVNFFDWAPAQPEKIANSECIQVVYFFFVTFE